MDAIELQSERIVMEIKRRAMAFVNDNYRNPTPQDLLAIETAMLIGSSITLEVQAEIEHSALTPVQKPDTLPSE